MFKAGDLLILVPGCTDSVYRKELEVHEVIEPVNSYSDVWFNTPHGPKYISNENSSIKVGNIND